MAASETLRKFAPVAATPVLKAILEMAGTLKLVPLAHWEWDESTTSVITYIVAIAGAAVGCIWTVRSRRARTIMIAVGVIALVASFLAYSWVRSTPPTPASAWMYDVVGYTSFFMTQVAFGFVVARTAKVFGG